MAAASEDIDAIVTPAPMDPPPSNVDPYSPDNWRAYLRATRTDEEETRARELLQRWRSKTWRTMYSHQPFGPSGFLPDSVIATLASRTSFVTVSDLSSLHWLLADLHGVEILALLHALDRECALPKLKAAKAKDEEARAAKKAREHERAVAEAEKTARRVERELEKAEKEEAAAKKKQEKAELERARRIEREEKAMLTQRRRFLAAAKAVAMEVRKRIRQANKEAKDSLKRKHAEDKQPVEASKKRKTSNKENETAQAATSAVAADAVDVAPPLKPRPLPRPRPRPRHPRQGLSNVLEVPLIPTTIHTTSVTESSTTSVERLGLADYVGTGAQIKGQIVRGQTIKQHRGWSNG